MSIFVIGTNHKKLSIETREKFFLTPIQQELLLSELKNDPRVVEAFVVSTCNRTEVYLHVIKMAINPCFVIEIIADIKKQPLDEGWQEYFYTLFDGDCVGHLLKVTTGMDSLILGEKQILGQVKAAFERSRSKGFFGKHFNILSNVAIRAGKKAQTETKISYGGSSISWAAIARAEQELGELSDKSVLVIGAGQMSKLAVGQISNKGFRNLYLMNRTYENACTLANQFNGEAVSFCDLKESLGRVDLCICSVGAPHYILDEEIIRRAMALRGERKLVLVDISMPRNIDPKVAAIENAVLFHIDDLKSVVQQSMSERQRAACQVEQIIRDKVAEYYAKIEKIHEYEALHQTNPSEVK